MYCDNHIVKDESRITAFPWRIVAHLRWGESASAAEDRPYVRTLRSTIIADYIALRRLARRGDRGDARDWLDRHPDLAEFLHWCDTAEGCVARARAKGALGPILDAYLAQLWGE